MPRLPRIYLDGAIYLIVCRGQDAEKVFNNKADAEMYLELVNRYKEQYGFRLYAYTLLPERLHLLIEPGSDATISQIMHDLNSAYTKYFNSKNSRRGHLFESRFKSALVEKAKHLLEATRFIHRQSTVSDTLISSLEVYVMRQEGETPSSKISIEKEIQEVFNFLKSRNNAHSYKRYCLEGPDEDERELEKLFKRSSVIGSTEFMERVENRIKEHVETRKDRAVPASNRTVLFILGGVVLLATMTAIYFYVEQRKMQSQYDALIQHMEANAVINPLAEPPREGYGGIKTGGEAS